MKYGFWLPVFGGWLRNVEQENMDASFSYSKRLVQAAEEWGFHTTLVAELFLNDIKGPEADTLDAWTTSAALAAVTEKIEIMAAVRPNFHNPAITAKMAANIDQISEGRFTLNVVSSWWEEEAKQYGAEFTAHDERYDRTEEFIHVLKGLWTKQSFSFHGSYYEANQTVLNPKPVQQPNPTLYAGGESRRAKDAIVHHCDAYVMHGGRVEEIKEKIVDMKNRREDAGLAPFKQFGMAAFVVCRDTKEEALEEVNRITDVKDSSAYSSYEQFVTKSQLEQQVERLDYSVSNRGLRPHLIGTPEQIAARILSYEQAGVDLLLLQFSPQYEEMERFAKQVMPIVEEKRASIPN
ncbi:alkanesulfonate monooxygenase [Pontibacillus halophilus JSM 076056 = DSM 19796]|uniref:Alkanesulfonate monooxygenase n=1 Tax=Pontibacillus halophilus JSM 076056 = DSM 19796 TaxID=1385510 RepID=A0A0A5GR72_9BACI|nr:LLM class flavin-dependent oxidoreductase [Pontibacillus halophilus]KGX93753.1 alkanesulfonate monooxygenase [Pontibacillus halophilus JSM 076056 = DSM 19796]